MRSLFDIPPPSQQAADSYAALSRPSITLLRSDTTNVSTFGSTPCQVELRRVHAYSFTLLRIRTKINPPSWTGSRNTFEHFASWSGKGRNKKVVMHSLAGHFSLARVLARKTISVGSVALSFAISFLGVLWLGLSFHCFMPSKFPFLSLIFLGRLSRSHAWIEGWILNAA